jgi:hypothetical protein
MQRFIWLRHSARQGEMRRSNRSFMRKNLTRAGMAPFQSHVGIAATFRMC